MFSLANRKNKTGQKGFTIVELLIVIVVIGILATLVIVTFTGIQKKARDSQRQTDIQAIASHVESFNATNGYYPSLKDLQTASVLSAQFKGLDPEALKDPKGGAISDTLSATNYSYVATGASCTNTAVTDPAATAPNTCDGYTVTATLESGSTYVKKSN